MSRKNKKGGDLMAVKKFKALNSSKSKKFSRSWITNRRWQSVVGAIVFIVVVGAIGYHFLGQSHAYSARYRYFYGSRTNNMWNDPVSGWGVGTLGVGWHDVQCQAYVPQNPTIYAGYKNYWWAQLVYHNHDWVSEVFISDPATGQGGSDPYIPSFCYGNI